MKRIYLSALLLAGFAGAASAQSAPSVGVRAGVNYASLEGKSVKADYRFGYSAGIFLNVPLTADGALSLQQEASYALKGFKGSRNGVKSNLQLGYVESPLVFRYKKNNIFAEAGAQAGIVVKTKYTFKTADTEGNTDQPETLGLKTFDVSYVGGVGYQMENGFQGGLRYTRSLNKAFNDGTLLGLSKVRHSVFQLYVAYSISGK